MKKRIYLFLVFIIGTIGVFTACRNNTSKSRISSSPSISTTNLFETEKENIVPAPTDLSLEPIINMTMKSKNVEDNFVIDISLPEKYDKTKKYPVIYLTDGNWRRQDHKDIHILSNQNIIKDVITVGIGYSESYDVDEIRKRDFLVKPDKFLSFIVDELIPYVDKNYSTDVSDRTLWGSSHGGHFALYSLVQYKNKTEGIFKNYILASPTLWNRTQGKDLYQMEEQLFEKTKKLPLNVYLTVGGLEDKLSFIEPFDKIIKQIEQHNYKELNIQFKIDEGKDHMTVWKPTLIEGIKMFYGLK